MRENNPFDTFKEAFRKFTSLNMLPDLTFQINKSGLLVEFTKHKHLIHSIFPGELKGMNIHDVMPTQAAKIIMDAVNTVLETGGIQQIELKLSVEGESRLFEGIFAVSGEKRVFGIFRDISEYSSIMSQILELAHNDSLTGLPNRYLFIDRLKQALANAKRKNKLLAILFIDIDNFKHINDTLSHHVGDRLLQSAAERISNYVRKIDAVSRLGIYELQSTVARLGGDEYTILLTDINDVQDIAKIAERITDIFKEPFNIEDHEYMSLPVSEYLYIQRTVTTLIPS